MLETAVFGGGCFWCTEATFRRLKGVEKVTSGYAGGKTKNPNYFTVSEELTGHAEVIKVEFNPQVISYQQLLEVFWLVHDPTQLNRQGPDQGTQYRSIILYTTNEQRILAEASLKHLESTRRFANRVVTELVALDEFYDAETYHQRYFDRNADQPYCSVIIQPKVDKLYLTFPELIKPEFSH